MHTHTGHNYWHPPSPHPPVPSSFCITLFFLIIALCFSFSLSIWGHSASFSIIIIIIAVLLCLVRMPLRCLLLIHPIRLDCNGVAGHNKEQTKAITSYVSLAPRSLSSCESTHQKERAGYKINCNPCC